MRRLVLLCAFVVACASTAGRLEDAQTDLEYNRARYLRLCDQGNSVTTPCIDYGTQINRLSDEIGDASAALQGGELPRTARSQLAKARSAVRAAAARVN